MSDFNFHWINIHKINTMKKKSLLLFVLAAQFAYSQCTYTYVGTVNCTCYGVCDGSATVSVTGGTPPFAYVWSTLPPQMTATATNLCAGLYQCIVTDVTGFPCLPMNTPPTITQPPQLILNIQNVVHTLCGFNNGSAAAVGTGGTGTLSYSWNTVPVQNTSVAGNLPPGTYTVTVTDANNCTRTATVTINSSTSPVVTYSSTNATCATCCDGSYSTSISGGTPPYALDAACGTVSNVCPGIYTCCVIDAYGCIGCVTMVITYPTSINENISDDGIKISPNPFSTTAVITISDKLRTSPDASGLKLFIYDVFGRQVNNLILDPSPSGEGLRAIVERGNLQRGIYFYKVTSDDGMIGAGKIIIE
jgi:hypothetical protein